MAVSTATLNRLNSCVLPDSYYVCHDCLALLVYNVNATGELVWRCPTCHRIYNRHTDALIASIGLSTPYLLATTEDGENYCCVLKENAGGQSREQTHLQSLPKQLEWE